MFCMLVERVFRLEEATCPVATRTQRLGSVKRRFATNVNIHPYRKRVRGRFVNALMAQEYPPQSPLGKYRNGDGSGYGRAWLTIAQNMSHFKHVPAALKPPRILPPRNLPPHPTDATLPLSIAPWHPSGRPSPRAPSLSRLCMPPGAASPAAVLVGGRAAWGGRQGHWGANVKRVGVVGGRLRPPRRRAADRRVGGRHAAGSPAEVGVWFVNVGRVPPWVGGDAAWRWRLRGGWRACRAWRA